MRKTLLTLTLFVVLAFQAYADEYLLTMCKDDKVCQYMWKIINQDMRKHGKFIPENHEEYNWIEWDDKIFVFDKKYEESIYDGWSGTGKIATFDINNDGVKETVLFEKFSVSGVLRDNLSFLPLEYYTRFKKKIYYADYTKDKHSLSGGDSYELKELPVEWFDGLRQYYIDIGGMMYIRPLKIESKYYISLFGSHRQGYPKPPMDQGNFIVISQYDANNNLQDVCYFIRAYSWGKKRGDK